MVVIFEIMAEVAENGIEENGEVDVPEIELIIRVSTSYFD